ncbi:MAG TPA: transposase [Thermoanaerobaculia bacterium]|nr:transposase [Thermoanaerobaculia bacterium]
MRHDNFIPDARVMRPHSRGRLPHWRVDNGVYFITFRLRDSLPRELAKQLFVERDHMLRGCTTSVDRARLDAAFGLRLDLELDRHRGSCVLREHAGVIADALKHFDRDRYELHAWCVMPNHVHVMMHVSDGNDVPKIVHSWKSYTARAIGRGVIWQREYFDRVVRSPREFADTRAYIRENPAKAGLMDWAWVG